MTGLSTVIVARSFDYLDRPTSEAIGYGNAAWPAADLGIYIPFTVPDTITAARMFWRNGTVTTPPTMDVGIYDAAGTRLVSSGPTTVSGANAWQVVDIADTALTKNTKYYMAAVSSTGATDTFGRHTVAAGLWGLYGVLKEESLASSTLPATATFATWADYADFFPHIGITTSASTNQPKLS